MAKYTVSHHINHAAREKERNFEYGKSTRFSFSKIIPSVVIYINLSIPFCTNKIKLKTNFLYILSIVIIVKKINIIKIFSEKIIIIIK